jgi:hypothetical protein
MHTMRSLLLGGLGAGPLAAVLAASSGGAALAQPPDPALLARVAHHAQAFEDITKHASFTFESTLDKLDGDGKVDDEKRKKARIDMNGAIEHQTVYSSSENGKDTTAAERERIRKREADAAKEKKSGRVDEDLHMPFLATEQSKYRFDQIAVDPANPTRVEIAFAPIRPDKGTLEGTAWVDATTGTVVSAGVKLSEPPSLVSWVHFTIEFGAPTPLGPAASRVTFEGEGGFLFIRKHFKGEMTLSDYRIPPAPAVAR